ncbi:MAG: asparagine synthase (glutamine-hydrolyzing) [Acidobacteria bacterium]|nr:asparagine synthase (glutamine-hydrolyzing) [Acidobacteriota bacterium]
MCGIVGWVSVGEKDPTMIEKLASMLRHRGPDSSGFWRSGQAHLGHTRLSIIDLTPAADQPMQIGSQVLVYNGEVYNFRDLRREFPGDYVSHGDSEVVLRAYRALGETALTRFEGMFAFAIWDEATQELFLARDRFGIKPLYYRPLGDGIAFASEVAPLLELGRPDLDWSALRDFLVYGYVPTPKTPWKGIFKLPAAHYLRWRAGGFSIQRYWNLEPGSRTISDERLRGELDERLRHAIEASAVADVPLGLFLSGGTDSAAIACFSSPSIRAFTLHQPERHRDESDHAAALCRHLGLEHQVVSSSTVDLPTAVDTMVSVFGEPFGDSAGLAAWLLARAVSREVKVVLTGEGGDELFYGYRWHGRAMTCPPSRLAGIGARLLPRLTRPARSNERRSLEGLERYAAFVGLFSPAQLGTLLGPVFGGPRAGGDDLFWHLRRFWREDLPLQQRVQFVDFHTYLPDDLLTKVDRASMAWSLEVRPPLLDHRLVELAVTVEAAMHRDPLEDRSKRLLRRQIEQRLPAGYLDRPKSGFNLGIRRRVRRHRGLWKEARERLYDSGVVGTRRLLDLTNDQIWALLVLDRWLVVNAPGYGHR